MIQTDCCGTILILIFLILYWANLQVVTFWSLILELFVFLLWDASFPWW